MIDVDEKLLLLIASKNLLNNTDWSVICWTPWWEFFLKFIDYRVIYEYLSSQSIEFVQPGFADDFTVHGGLEGIFSQFLVLTLVFEGTNGSFDGKDEVTSSMTFEGKTTSLLAIPEIFNDGILETSGLEGNDWSSTNEEFVLYNTSWLENRRHKTKVTTSVDNSTISEEFIWGCPEAMWILVPQMPHLSSTVGGIRFSHISWTSHKELDFVVELLNDMLSNLKDQVDTLLGSDSTNEGEKRD